MRKRLVLGVGAVLLGVGGAGWYFGLPLGNGAPPPVAPPPVPVALAVAEARDVPAYLRGIGTVQPYNLVTVKSRVDGHIAKVAFTEGQNVRAGDLLFEIDPRPYQAVLEQALATKAKDEATLQGARLDLERYAKLVGRGFQTRQSFDLQKALVGQLEGTVHADAAQIEAARLNLSYAEIRSPIAGRTGARLVDIGNFVQVSQGTSLVTVTQTKPIYVSFTLPQGDLAALRRNAQTDSQADALTVLAYAGDETNSEKAQPGAEKAPIAEGKLTLIDNQVDPQTGTIHLKASFANADERLWPGAFVNVRVVQSVHRGIVTVPAKTAMEGPQGYYVYVVGADDAAEQRPVQLAGIEGGLALVEKGLAAGERVVVEGQYRLTKGTKVKGLP